MPKQNISSSQKSEQHYISTLDSISRRRYEDKLSLVNNIDPYEHHRWSNDTKDLPKIEQDDISEYLVHRVSFYTREKFKAEKQLGAHNQLTSGWVKNISSHKPQGCDNIIIKAEVVHSQCLSEKPLKPWVIAQQDGTVLTAHCDCMAGIAESCSHVAALLFTVDSAVRLRDSITPTQLPASWIIPSNKEVMYKEASEIQFTSAFTKKRQLENIIEGNSGCEKSRRKCTQVPAPTQAELDGLFSAIKSSRSGVKPAILSVIPKYLDEYVPSNGMNSLPCFFGDFYDEKMASKNYNEVLNYCEEMKTTINMGSEQAAYADEQSRGQANSKLWMRMRTGRVIASNAYKVCHTNPSQPSLSLIREICNPAVKRVQTAAMKWGLDHEQTALESYVNYMVNQHEDFRVKQCGVFINPMAPFLAASPDGMSCCSCHGLGCIEIKCPASKAFCTVEECCQSSNFCLEQDDNGLMLKHSHPYYLQVQMQLLITEANFCDFVVWTTKNFVVLRISPNTDVMNEMVPKMEHFFTTAILPELVGHCFSRSRPQPLQESPTKANNEAEKTTAKLFCYCKRTEEEDDMIGCDNQNCPIEWFHYFCVGIKTAPKGLWYCPDCRQLSQFIRGGKNVPKKGIRKSFVNS